MEDFLIPIGFKSWFGISVPLSLLLTWSVPFNPISLIFLTCFMPSLVVGQRGGDKSVFLYLAYRLVSFAVVFI